MFTLALSLSLLLGAAQSAADSHPAATPAMGSQVTDLPANATTPVDPKQRLELGWSLNGLQGRGIHPWHIIADYEVFDAQGKSTDKGTFEESWVSDTKYKLTYRGTVFSQEEYGTDRGVFHAGYAGWPSGPLRFLHRALVQPLPPQETLGDQGQRNLVRKFGTVQLTCTALSYQGGKEVDEKSASFCFDPAKDILRYSNTSNGIDQTTFDRISLFQDHFLANEITILFLGKPSLTIHVERLEPLSQKDEADILLPANAARVIPRLQIVPAGCGSSAIKKVPPQYPVDAKSRGIQGIVVLDATIGTDGRTHELHAMTGPPLLVPAAAEAVRNWMYNPCLVGGEPVEVETEVSVIFKMSGR